MTTLSHHPLRILYETVLASASTCTHITRRQVEKKEIQESRWIRSISLFSMEIYLIN